MSESGVFQILTHDNYEETNGIQLKFSADWRIKVGINFMENHNFEFKNWKKKPRKFYECWG